MREDQVDLIRDSFVEVLRAGDVAAQLFYGRLFDIAPETRALFEDDLAEQGRLLIASLTGIVTGLSHVDEVLPALRELAVRHVAYGAERRHYALVGDALGHMLAQVSGARFDAATRGAWCAAYTLVSQTMIAAAYGPDDAAALRPSPAFARRHPAPEAHRPHA